MLKIEYKSRKYKKKIKKMFLVFEITVSENDAKNCLCKEENTSHRQSMG